MKNLLCCMRTSRFWTPKPSQWPVISSRSIKLQVLIVGVTVWSRADKLSRKWIWTISSRNLVSSLFIQLLQLAFVFVSSRLFCKVYKKPKSLCQTFPGQAKTVNASILPGDGIASNIRHGWCFWKSSVKNIRISYISYQRLCPVCLRYLIIGSLWRWWGCLILWQRLCMDE